MSGSAFYFDLASPEAYLVAERILTALPGPVEWQPILARELPRAESFESYRCASEAEIIREGIERRAHTLNLQPLRWPDPFPFDSSAAMRVATYAKGIGRVVPFAQAAFRQAFAGGHNLEQQDFVLIAAAACEMHPQAVKRGAELRSVHEQLAAATAAAAAAGVEDVPAIRIKHESPHSLGRELEPPHRVFTGERALQDAARYLDELTGASAR